jgi:hypothetical protein
VSEPLGYREMPRGWGERRLHKINNARCLFTEMKQSVRWVAVLVAACAIGSFVTYRIAHHRGYESGYRNGVVSAIGHGNFGQSVALFASLQKIRAGDVPDATRFMEKVCFSSAQIFYKDPTAGLEKVSDWGRAQGWGKDQGPASQEFARELIKYRATYRTNSAEWDDMERKLNITLAKLK